jgi:ribosomal protein S18 acetylase RimI-like enzyme
MLDLGASVRSADPGDISEIVSVHLRAFPGYSLTDMGPRFLASLYRGFAKDECGVLLVAESPQHGIIGLLAGTRAPDRFFRALLMRRGLRLAFTSIPGVMRHPIRLGERLLSAIRYRGDRPVALPGYWLLSSLAVASSGGRSGVGGALVDRFCTMAAAERSPGVYLVTDADDNHAVLQFYQKHKFTTHSRKERRDGRRLVVLTRSSL